MNKIVYYRNRCIGCGICYEQQPTLWRMSKKDGKATLLKSTEKKGVYVSPVNNTIQQKTMGVAKACPVKIIKIV